jgi:hypothetical protein
MSSLCYNKAQLHINRLDLNSGHTNDNAGRSIQQVLRALQEATSQGLCMNPFLWTFANSLSVTKDARNANVVSALGLNALATFKPASSSTRALQ